MDPLESGLCSRRERGCLVGQSTVPSGCKEKSVPAKPACAERSENVGGPYPTGSVRVFGALIGGGETSSSTSCEAGGGGIDSTSKAGGFSAGTSTDGAGAQTSESSTRAEPSTVRGWQVALTLRALRGLLSDPWHAERR